MLAQRGGGWGGVCGQSIAHPCMIDDDYNDDDYENDGEEVTMVNR